MAIGTGPNTDVAEGVPGDVRGWDLKAERVRRGLRAADVAARLGVTRSRVTYVEGRMRVSPAFAKRYRAVLGPRP